MYNIVAMHLLWGFSGMFPQQMFLSSVILVCFGVCFDKIYFNFFLNSFTLLENYYIQ